MTIIRPLRDNIFLRPLEWQPSELIHVIRHGRPLRGEIVAIGPGEHRKKYAPGRGSYKLSAHFTPTELKPGDVVELGGLNIFDGQGYDFSAREVDIDGERLLVISEKDVAMVVEAA